MAAEEVIVDVREDDEFDAERVEGSVHLPLSSFPTRAPGVLQALADKKLVLMCRSGRRAELAKDEIARLGFPDVASEVYAGGILAWKKQGKPVVTRRASRIPVMRQVQLVVGPCVLAFSALAALKDPRWAWASAFFGAGLTLAGATGFCGMAKVLSLMPWNRGRAGRDPKTCG